VAFTSPFSPSSSPTSEEEGKKGRKEGGWREKVRGTKEEDALHLAKGTDAGFSRLCPRRSLSQLYSSGMDRMCRNPVGDMDSIILRLWILKFDFMYLHLTQNSFVL
jgi:hypothetical protein